MGVGAECVPCVVITGKEKAILRDYIYISEFQLNEAFVEILLLLLYIILYNYIVFPQEET